MKKIEENYILEAKRIIKLIDVKKLTRKNDILFVVSMQNKIKFNDLVTKPQLFWLRDLKDRQLEE